MQTQDRNTAKLLYTDTYMATLDYMIKHSASGKFPKTKEMHIQAKQIAQYKTFMVTGVNITNIDMTREQRHRVYTEIGQAKKSKVIGQDIRRMMGTGVAKYGNSTSMSSSAMSMQLRKTLNAMDPVARQGILKAIGMENDGNLTKGRIPVNENAVNSLNPGAGGKERRFIKMGDSTPLTNDPRLAKANEKETRMLRANAVLNKAFPDEYYVENPIGVKEAKGRELVSEAYAKLFDEVPTDGTNMHTEHEMLDHILGRYNSDPFNADKSIQYNGANVLDAHERVQYKRVAADDLTGLPLHEIEKDLFDRISEGRYQTPAFKGIFTSLEAHDDAYKIAEEFRGSLLNARDIASSYLNMVKSDKVQLRAMRSAVMEAKKTKTPLTTILQQDNYRPYDFVSSVLSGIGKDADDSTVMSEMGYYIRKDLFIPLDMLETDSKNHSSFRRALDAKLAAINNPEENYYYGTAKEYRDFMKDYNDMYRELNQRQRVVAQEIRDVNFSGEERGHRNGLLDDQERDNLYAHTTKDVVESEFTDKVKADAERLGVQRESSNRQRIRNMVLEQMEKDNGKGQAMKNTLLTTIENNIGSLTTVPKSNSPEDIRAANEEFATKLLTHLKVSDKAGHLRNLTHEGAMAITEGFRIDPANLKGTRARVQEQSEKLVRPLTSVLEQKELLTNQRMSMWRDAAYRQHASGDLRYLRMPGRQGRFQIAKDETGMPVISDKGITLEGEHILADGIKVSMDVDPGRIHTIMDELEALRYNQVAGQQWAYTQAQETIRDSFVELVYQSQSVNESMRADHPEFYEKLVRLEKNMNNYLTAEQKAERRRITLPVANLLEPYNKYMSRVDDGTTDNVLSRLPNMIKNLINSKLPYMRQIGRGDELASMAYMAMLDAAYTLPKERSIDLSDEGLLNRFKNTGKPKTEEEIAAFQQKISSQGLKTRLDNFMSERIQNQMYNQFYNRLSPEEQRGAGESVVQDVFNMMNEQYQKTGSGEFRPTASNVRSFIQKMGDGLRDMPFYGEAMKFSEPEINEIIRDGELGNKRVSFESYMQKLNEDHSSTFEREHEVALSEAKNDIERAAADQFYETMRAQEHDVLDDISKGRDLKDTIERNADMITERLGNLNVRNHNELDFLYDMHMQSNPNSPGMTARVPFQGEEYNALIRRASGGQMVAQIPALNLTVPIERHSSDARRVVLPHEIEPEQSFAGRTVEEITSSPGVRATHIGDYSSIQRNVHSNPSDTFMLMKELMEGDRNGVYLDIETTGLSGSTIPEHLIQPLEIYMQEGQWSKKKNDFYRKGGEVGVRVDGKTQIVSDHMFIRPSDDVVNYARHLMSERPFQLEFNAGGVEPISILDVLKAKASDQVGAYENIRKRVLSTQDGVKTLRSIDETADRIWFLRNLAKYSGNRTTFMDHIGANDGMLEQENLQTYINQLFRDTQQALKNFEINPETNGLRLFDIMPEFSTAKVVSPQEAVGRYAAFTDGKIIMGQNVAKADIQKFFGIADNFLEQEMTNLFNQKDEIIDALTRDLASRKDSAFDSYVTMVDPQDPNRRFSLLTQEQINGAFDGKSEIKPEMMSVLNDLIDDPQDMQRAFLDVAERHYGGNMAEMSKYIDPEVGMDSVYVIPEGQITDATRASREGLINRIRNAGPEEFADLVREHGLADVSRLDEAVRLRGQLQLPEVIEQMFAASYALPELQGRSAEKIQEALGRNVSSAQHTGKGDVRVGFDVMGDLLRRSKTQKEFQDFDGRLLAPGDFVQRHSGGDSLAPLGTYRVDEILDNQIHMTAIRFDGDQIIEGQRHVLEAANKIDLDRRYQIGFEFLGDEATAKAAYNEFAVDQARRQISRATQSAFNFDRYETEYKLRNADPTVSRGPLELLKDRREKMTRPGTELMDRVALDTTPVFERQDFNKLATWDITASKRAAFDAGGEFYNSAEGQARRAFLGEVSALQDIGVIDNKVGRNLIRQMNESIIAKGKEKGYTRVPVNMAHAGVLDETFGSLSGNMMSLDLTSKSRLSQSLFSYAQRVMDRTDTADGAAFLLESERKAMALNNTVFPFLKSQGLLEYEDSITMGEALNQIMSREVIDVGATRGQGQLQRFEEYDYLAYQRNAGDTDFINHIENTHSELLAPYRDSLSPVQRDIVERQIADINTLRAANSYDPNMIVRPRIDLERFPADTMDINDFGSLKQTPTGVLESVMNRVKGSGIVEDVELRRNIVNELFERATAGKPNSIESMISQNLNEPERMEAARILGYVEGNMQDGYRPGTNIGEMMFGRKAYTGPNSPLERFSDRKIKELPRDLIANIMNQSYTEASGESFISGLLYQYTHVPNGRGDWVESNWVDTHAGPKSIPFERVKKTADVTTDDLIAAGVNEADAPSHLRDMVQKRKELGEAAAQKRSVITEQSMDIENPFAREEPGMIRKALGSARENISEFVGEGGTGRTVARAGMWVAGLGIAAYALKQFASAGGPLKFEHRPQGHGVEGIGGTGDNDDMNRKDNLETATSRGESGGKAYVTPNGSSAGFSIRARAKNGGNISHSDVTNEMQSQIGSFNVNLRDDRQKMDRDWLEGQMDQYINRGHLG